MKVAVIVLTCGEPQFPHTIRSVVSQNSVDVNLQIVRDLPIKEAHETLLQMALREAGRSEWILKLDGDMRLLQSDALTKMVRFAANAKTIARLSLPVYDWYTYFQLGGVLLFRPDALESTALVDDVLHDKWIDDIPGLSIRFLRRHLVDHGHDASVPQAIRFGYQRGIKAHVGGPRHHHWLTLNAIHSRYLSDPSHVSMGAMIGALYGIEALPEEMEQNNSRSFENALPSLVDFTERTNPASELARFGLETSGAIRRLHLRKYRSRISIAHLRCQLWKSRLQSLASLLRFKV